MASTTGVEGEQDSVPDPNYDGSVGCKCKGNKGRNLVVCIDGTANQFNVKNTNVVELYSRLLKDDSKQLTFYNSGIGTYAEPSWRSLSYIKQIIGHKIDLAIAWRFERILLDAYRWLSEVYTPGDRIFLFGFSRGAHQVRALSAMIELVGLIRRGNEAQIPFAYELYAHCNQEIYQTATDVNRPNMGFSSWAEMLDHPDNQKYATIKAFRFRETFSREDVRVHFVGAWDTVSSVGIIRGDKGLPLTGNGMKHVCYFRHALALDERRVKFLPEFAYGGSSRPPAETKNKGEATRHSGSWSHTKEVWFAGTHSDIGGGSTENPTLDANKPPLRWMLREANIAGLHEGPSRHKYRPSKKIDSVSRSLTPIWWILEILFIKRLTYRDENHTTWWPHWGLCRPIIEGHLIHSTVERLGRIPQIQDRFPQSWNKKANFESDAFDRASELLNHLDSDVRQAKISRVGLNQVSKLILTSSEELCQISETHEGRLSLRDIHGSAQILDGILHALPETELEEDSQRTVAMLMTSILLEFAEGLLDRRPIQAIHRILQNMPRPLNESITRFIRTFFIDRQIVSGSYDNTIRVWNAATGQQIGDPLKGHEGWVCSVTFSPNGLQIASGSDDTTIGIWDAATGQQIGGLLRGHTSTVLSVAFFPDGNQIVSGSNDGTIRFWNAATAKQVGVPLKGHEDEVITVAISPSGTQIVSGYLDGTICVWDAATRQQIGTPWRGHRDRIWFVAFSPNGTQIVSGSADHTIRVWDAATGKPVGRPFTGHWDVVRSVAFSPNGTRIVSGSWDKTVRVWDVATGQQIGEPFRGHKGMITSVSFSSDGDQIVSGSTDRTLRLWNTTTGKQIGNPFVGHTDELCSVAFSPQ